MTWTIKHMGRRLSKQTDLPVSVYVCACVSVICVLPCLLLLVLYGLLRLCLRPSVLLAGCLSICQSLSLPACRLPAYACAQLSGDCVCSPVADASRVPSLERSMESKLRLCSVQLPALPMLVPTQLLSFIVDSTLEPAVSLLFTRGLVASTQNNP